MKKSNLLYAALLSCIVSGCNTDDSLGKFTVRHDDGMGKTQGEGDSYEGALAEVISEDGNYKFSARCDTKTTTRSDYYYAPSVRVSMWVSGYNPTTKQIFNSKKLGYLEEKQTFDILKSSPILNYGAAVSFDVKGWKGAWNQATAYCYSAYNIYIKEWNKKKGTEFEEVALPVYKS